MVGTMNAPSLLDLKQFNLECFGHAPQLSQWQVHDSTASVIVISGGEGSGKSKTTSAEIAARYGTWKRVLFACYQSESASNESDYLVEFLSAIGAVVDYSHPKQGNIKIMTRDGAIVESVSTHQKGAQAVSGTGKSYDIIAMLEAGKQPYSVYLACLLRISRTGGLLILSGTIEKSEPWFADTIQKLREDSKRREEMNAEVVILPTWENRLLYPLGRDDPKIKVLESTLTPELFLERLAGEPSPPEGLVLKGFSFLTHVFDWVVYDPRKPVHVAIDPGYSGSHYSVNFLQEHPRAYTRQFHSDLPDASLTDVWVIGDLYLNYTTHEEIIALAKELEWWGNVRDGVGDVIMKTHPQADRAPVDVWLQKANIFLRAQPISIQDNVDRHRTFLVDPHTKQPRIFFNPNVKGMVEYGRWKKKQIAEDLFGQPEDKNCDFTKAIGYYLIDRFGRVEGHVKNTAQSVGERVTIDKATTQMPVTVGAPRTLQMVKPTVRRSSGYAVVKKMPRRGM